MMKKMSVWATAGLVVVIIVISLVIISIGIEAAKSVTL